MAPDASQVPAPTASRATISLQVPIAPDAALALAAAERDAGALVFRSIRFGGWVVGRNGRNGAAAALERDGAQLPDGWTVDAVLRADGLVFGPIPLRFTSPEAATPFADLHLLGDPTSDDLVELYPEDLEAFVAAATGAGRSIGTVETPAWALEVRR